MLKEHTLPLTALLTYYMTIGSNAQVGPSSLSPTQWSLRASRTSASCRIYAKNAKSSQTRSRNRR